MKKLVTIALASCALAAFAAFDVVDNTARIVAIAPQSIGTSGTAAILSVPPIKGGCGLYCTVAGNVSRTNLVVTLYNTNAVNGGWTRYARAATTDTNAVLLVASFAGEYVTPVVKVEATSEASATSGSVLLLGTK